MQYGGYDHVHVSEREPASQPDDPLDPPGWEDCTWASGTELARAAGINAPATLAEAEALRKASGEPPFGGSNIGNLRDGMQARYGWSGDVAPNTEVITLPLGHAATVQGSMGAWPDGSPWRRWDPPFEGPHAVTVFRLDLQPRVWWCDPLAPVGWEGEWMSLTELDRFIKALPTGNLMRTPIVAGEPMIVGGGLVRTSDYTIALKAGQPIHKTPNGAVLTKLSKDATVEYFGIAEGWYAVEIATAVGFPDGKARPVIAYVPQTAGTPKAKPVVPDTTPYSQADLDTARAAGQAEGYIGGKVDGMKQGRQEGWAEARTEAVKKVGSIPATYPG